MSFLDYMTAARRGYAQLKHRFSRRPVAAGERGVNLALLMADRLSQKEKAVTLPYLTPQRAVQLFEHYRRGEFAPVMLEWEQMEQYDDTLFPARNKRLAALKRMKWMVEADADAVGDDPALQQLAEQQRVAALKALSKVENLDSILPEFGEADFNGITAIERTGSLEVREVWRVIDPWHLYQPFRNGDVFYNAEADDVPQRAEELEPEAVIIRRAPAANVPVMFLILRKHLTDEQWDAFIATYGLPNIFFELPPATDERRAAELDAVVQRLASDGRGTLPNGTKVQTVETQQRDGTLFQQRVKECRDSIITIILGGTLTMETESGSGTLAGNAHADSFAELCEGSAHDIGAVVDEQFVRPLLRKLFPGQPILVHFDYRPQDAADAAAAAQTLATLKTAGWQVSAETASEMLGFEVQEAPQESTMYNVQSTNQGFSRAYGAETIGNRAEGAGDVAAPSDEAPLTKEELDALALVQNAMDPDVLRKKAAAIAGTLYGAMTGKQGETVMNKKKRKKEKRGGVGGPNCEAKSEKTCRCKKDRSYLPKSVQDVASEAEDAFFADLDNETIYSRPDGSEADMDPDFMEEVDTWLKRSYNNLHNDCGLGYNEAKRLHYAAAKKAGELFEKAMDSYPEPLHETVEQQEAANKKRKNKKRVKTEIWHYLAPLDVPNATAPVEANITVIKFKGNKGKRIYNCILQKKGSTPRRVALQ